MNDIYHYFEEWLNSSHRCLVTSLQCASVASAFIALVIYQLPRTRLSNLYDDEMITFLRGTDSDCNNDIVIHSVCKDLKKYIANEGYLNSGPLNEFDTIPKKSEFDHKFISYAYEQGFIFQILKVFWESPVSKVRSKTKSGSLGCNLMVSKREPSFFAGAYMYKNYNEEQYIVTMIKPKNGKEKKHLTKKCDHILSLFSYNDHEDNDQCMNNEECSITQKDLFR